MKQVSYGSALEKVELGFGGATSTTLRTLNQERSAMLSYIFGTE